MRSPTSPRPRAPPSSRRSSTPPTATSWPAAAPRASSPWRPPSGPRRTSSPPSLRDLFGYRWAFRCSTEASSDTILGHGWASKGYTAEDIDPQARGVSWLRAEDGLPRKVKAAYLTDEQIITLADQAAALRRQAKASKTADTAAAATWCRCAAMMPHERPGPHRGVYGTGNEHRPGPPPTSATSPPGWTAGATGSRPPTTPSPTRPSRSASSSGCPAPLSADRPGPGPRCPDGLFPPTVSCRACQHITTNEHITITGGTS